MPVAARLRNRFVRRMAPVAVWLTGNLLVFWVLLGWREFDPRTRDVMMGLAHAQFIPLFTWLALGTPRHAQRLYVSLLLAALLYLEFIVCGLPMVEGFQAAVTTGMFLVVCALVVSAPMFLLRHAGWRLGVPDLQTERSPRRGSSCRLVTIVAGTIVTLAAFLVLARLLLAAVGYEHELAELQRRLPRHLAGMLLVAVFASSLAFTVVWAAFSQRRWPIWGVGILVVGGATFVAYFALTSTPRQSIALWMFVGGWGYLGLFFLLARIAGFRFVAAQGQPNPDRQILPYQFSLRSWLLGTVLVAIPLAWCTAVLREHERTIRQSEKWQAAGALAIVEAGEVVTLHVDAATIDTKALGELSSLRRLKQLSIRQPTDDIIDHLNGLDALESLILYDGSITGEGLAKLSQLGNLRRLTVTSRVSDADVSGLYKCQRLEHLDLADSTLTVPGALDLLRQLPQLRLLKFPEGELKAHELIVQGSLPAMSIGQLAQIPRIESLQAELSYQALRHLGQIQQLQVLSVSGPEISDSALMYLWPLPKLARLDVTRTQVTPAGALACLPNMPALLKLSFPHGEFRMKGDGQACEVDLTGDLPTTVFEQLGCLAHCEKLNLDGAHFAPGALGHLRRLSVLREIRLNGSSIGDDDLLSLIELPGLLRLDIERTNVTLEAVLQFARQRSATGIRLSVPPGRLSGNSFSLDTNVTASELKQLSELPLLERIQIEAGGVPVAAATLPPEVGTKAVDLVLKMSHLDELHVDCVDGPREALEVLAGHLRITTIALPSQRLQRDDLAALAALPGLKVLELPFARLGRGTLADLERTELLESLVLGWSRFESDELRHLRGLAHLRSLDLSSSNVVDADLVHLRGLPRLSDLNLSGTAITNVGLRHLERMLALRQLRLAWVRGVTRAGIEKLKQALPECNIQHDEAPGK
jgi:internalin A